ncbi:hypothetical protein Dfri01_58960 [Dyadobacter frigoris]|uniref:Eco57I restriction-modification methylase domain-containing protein n=1 Tax=Dyadobacter frigoris TaxID=2576211 RepID=UPI0024A24E3D|nr:DNA methyltransferase [Dyadobacter frigoris]GLU56435.1 hypothetical protein Dfri01_58960 [Dyadobacter frigoris]
MALSKLNFSNYIKQFKFREMFNDMGWNNDKTSQPITIDNTTYILQSVAEKSGFKILVCNPLADGEIPNSIIRTQIEAKLTKLFQEHLVIFFNSDKTDQLWQLAYREPGKPTKLTQTRYNINQDPELIFQRASGLFFTLEEEDLITIVDVTKRVSENFHQNNERITKQFYDKFKKEHSSFLSFVKGIDSISDKAWYASLMLNRLMFCYFIQKKGFLDGNKNYLRDKLNVCVTKRSKIKFYSFYKDFLLVLFQKGLNDPYQDSNVKIDIGNIPYLNGGLFDEHELEKSHLSIDIDDKAFENLFDFFDQYEWHLDTRITASGKDINPDVIGYIFEKYINDRAEMGAYYTKEDITDFISKNCILPYLFDETKRILPDAFGANGEIWSNFKNSGNLYVPKEVSKGTELELPKEIFEGIDDTEKRTFWNQPASEEFGIPSETWREVVERRKRYGKIQNLIDSGGINSIGDLITNNLNIRQFAQDVVEQTNDSKFLECFYKALSNVTIIDPTCGSGAFLFAAMNILEPLYESCIQRMENFVIESKGDEFIFFKNVVSNIKSPDHPNLRYFIYKSIILRNLYGVDLMKEAVEIAKLRLFLKLVATVEVDRSKPNLGLEPLPDIDFNIRAGNTLIGFASELELKNGLKWKLDFEGEEESIGRKCDQVANAFNVYKNLQLSSGDDITTFKIAKEKLSEGLTELNSDLNQLLHKQNKETKFNDWIQRCQPFHWFAEFYEIINGNGGFDIIIGNPPYLEVRQIDYEPKGLKTFNTNAVHSMCIERSLQILRSTGNISMIVPLSLVGTQRMKMVQDLIEHKRTTWYSNFSWRPGKLFDKVNRALTIFVANSSSNPEVFTTKYIMWNSDTRESLFPSLNFVQIKLKRPFFWVPKLGDDRENNIIQKVLSCDNQVEYLVTKSSNKVFYRTTGGLYWKIFTNFSPKFLLKGVIQPSSRETWITVKDTNHEIFCVALLSSNVFWWWYTVTSSLRDLNPIDVRGFKFPSSALNDPKILELGKVYLEDLVNNSTMLTRIQKSTGETQTQSFKISQSKPILDEIDKVLADHYGFTPDELDFISNYDIKFRIGRESEEDQ